MTEVDWLFGEDLQAMLEFLREKASERKLRLFACACCRLVSHYLLDERFRSVVDVAESLADGLVSVMRARQLSQLRVTLSVIAGPPVQHNLGSTRV